MWGHGTGLAIFASGVGRPLEVRASIYAMAPEPGELVLAGLGVAALLAMRSQKPSQV
jgi:hypothetical protein